MEKMTRNGLVAVVHSCRYGVDWYSGDARVLFDPEIVYMVEENRPAEELKVYCERMGYNVHVPVQWYDSVREFLDIYLIPEGTDFYIDSYDGCETIKTSVNWIKA